VTATDQTTTPLDLAPIRERLARYEAMADKLNDGKLPDLSRSATATAIGLAASFVAAYVPDLLAEVERLARQVDALNRVAVLYGECADGPPINGDWLLHRLGEILRGER
jgi:hypothetical protein